ncbi:D-mannonate dehydratase ManD [Microbacterium insulae]|uniref:D-mannonate dehydratase ManD n=1 Tax=Microbacterium insulae TaxID=483014 RepID=A0ABW3AJ54_9MICO
MRIESADVVVCNPGRNFVTLILRTSDGVVGIGDATLNGRELAVASYLKDHVVPMLIGRDASRIEDTWQYLYRGVYWRRGPITMAAIAAVDMALWDIKGKSAGMPVHELLGGRSRETIRAYGHAHGRDVEELIDSVHARRAQGFDAVRVQVGVPGMGNGYGVAEGRYEPARLGGVPSEEVWDTGRYLRYLPTVFERLRGEFGDELDLLHDVHHRLTPIQAAQLGRALEQYRPFWLEDMTTAENQESFRLIREHTTVPLATGETFNSIVDYLTLVPEQLIDYIRSAVTHAGGLTGLRRILDFGAVYQIKSAIHGPTDISPIGMAAAIHLDTVHHAFGIQEYMQHDAIVSEVFRADFAFADGCFRPGAGAGLGVTFDEEAAARFPYAAASLPVNRLLDGTVHDW